MATLTAVTLTYTSPKDGSTCSGKIYANYTVSTSATATTISGTVYVDKTTSSSSLYTSASGVNLSIGGTAVFSNKSANTNTSASATISTFSKTINRTDSQQSISLTLSGTIKIESVRQAWVNQPTAQGSNSVTIIVPKLPTCTTSVTSSAPYYTVHTSYSTYSVNVSNVSVTSGTSVSSIVLCVGTQTATRTNVGALSITLSSAGNFTPTVTIKDSANASRTYNLPEITVNQYNPPSVNFSAERINSNNVLEDEGRRALITANISYTDAICKILEPTVIVEDGSSTGSGTIDWYADSGLRLKITNWSNFQPESPFTIFGVMTGYGTYTEFDTNKSYQVRLTINDDYGSGVSITQMLPTAFYTVDFLAGGHGIAFGQAATEEGFFCAMDAHFKDKDNAMRALFDFIHPVGSYYHTSDSSFNPNDVWGGNWVPLGEGQVLLSAGSNYTAGQTYGDNTKPYTPAGTVGGKKLLDEHIAHGHGFTQPTISSHKHKMTNDTYVVTTNATAGIGRTSVKPGSGTAVSNLVQSTGGGLNRGGNETQNEQPTASGGKVSDLHGASSTRTAHDHSWTGTQATLNVMQKSVAVYIWHRTA